MTGPPVVGLALDRRGSPAPVAAGPSGSPLDRRCRQAVRNGRPCWQRWRPEHSGVTSGRLPGLVDRVS
jgi:hypothetical protein